MTLWSIARSPLIMGGNMPKNDAFTLSLLTNDEVIAVNQASLNNRQVFNHTNQVAWVADVPGSRDKYLALFNASPIPTDRRGGPPGDKPRPISGPTMVSISLSDIGLEGSCKLRDLWNHKDLGTVSGTVSAMINSHGASLLRVQPEN
jgi:hypothetical protein